MVWDKASEPLMAEAGRWAQELPGSDPINLYKNNTDNRSAF